MESNLYIFNFLLLAVFCIIQIKANEDTSPQFQNSVQQYKYNYAAAFPYLSAPSNINQNTATSVIDEQNIHDTQSQQLSPLDFTNYEKHDTFTRETVQNNNNENQESSRPNKPQLKYTEEQLNLPNPYLINSNVPKEGDQVPCPLYFPCKTKPEIASAPNFGEPSTFNLNRQTPPLQEQFPSTIQNYPLNQEGYQSISANDRSSIIPTMYSDRRYIVSIPEYTAGHKTQQNGEVNFDSTGVTVVCYGLECSTQIKHHKSNDYEPISSKPQNVEDSTSIISPPEDYIQSQQYKIFNAIINDLQYLRKVATFNFIGSEDKVNSNSAANDQQTIPVADEYRNYENNNNSPSAIDKNDDKISVKQI